MLRMQEMAFPGFKFQKFSGGGCPRTPLLAFGRILLRSDFMAASAPVFHLIPSTSQQNKDIKQEVTV